ncbi:hypothetical protein JEQ12_015815 [Ovis aries]|uniref:Ig-like domain-containing protein n=1 Tax=Ovis aries TaxID=9940 RepID=A0A836D434_SHEEP|nr:hypothetical protein JEQ12_015815 [Ovis aries]
MCLGLLCCVVLFFWGAGSMDTEVTQRPSHLIKGKDQKAKMDCVPKEGHAYVYWYRKKPEGAFEFLVYLQNQVTMEDTAEFKQRFSAECPQNSPCSLEIKSTKAADSALYFCASSQSTVLHVSSSQNTNSPWTQLRKSVVS